MIPMNPLKPLAFTAILICSIAAGSTWTPTSGPEGGRVTSIAYGGTVNAVAHLDCVMAAATLEVDGDVIISQGETS